MKGDAKLRPNPRGELPQVAASAFLDPSAQVVGNVRIGEEVFVGPGAVIRADEPGSSIEIGDRSNVQDRVVIHALEGSKVTIGSETSLAHGCIIHGPCTIGSGCFIGFGSVVFNAVLGDGVVVKHLAVVEGVEIDAGRVIALGSSVENSEKAKMLEPACEEDARFASKVVAANLSLLRGYRETG